MHENPYQAPQEREPQERRANAERKPSDADQFNPPRGLLIVIAAMVGVLILLAALCVRLLPLLFPDYPAD